MWTREVFIEAKKQVFKENSEALKNELEAAEVEDLVEQVTFEEEAVAAEAVVEATVEHIQEQNNSGNVEEAEELCWNQQYRGEGEHTNEGQPSNVV